jgi:hypothetical protein
MIAISTHSAFLGHSLFARKKSIRSRAHLMFVTVTKLRSSIERCDALCALRIAQRVALGLYMQVYWESRMFLQRRQIINSRSLTLLHKINLYC